MGDTVRQVDYYYALVPDRPGEGLKVLGELKRAGVSLVAYCGFPAGRGKAQLDFVLEDAAALRSVAKRLGLKLSARKRALLVQGEDRAGAGADVLENLARQKINVVAGQAVCAGAGRWGMLLWVKPAAFKRASKALGV